jgi:hypothetical protein
MVILDGSSHSPLPPVQAQGGGGRGAPADPGRGAGDPIVRAQVRTWRAFHRHTVWTEGIAGQPGSRQV